MECLHAMVRHVIGKVWLFVAFLLAGFCRIVGFFLGQVDWEPPAWLVWLSDRLVPLGRWCQAKAAWAALVVLVVGGIAWGVGHSPNGGWKNWWDKQNFSGAKPDSAEIRVVSISLSGPERTPYEEDGKPRPIILNFSISAAPLSRIGKEAVDIALSPALAGKWTWVAANRLEFLPDEDWPIGQQYTVTLGPKALAPHVSVERKLTFHSPRFDVSVREAAFYQDPVQVTLRKAVFDVAFTHPVNPEVFEKRLRLEADGAVANALLGKSADARKLTVTYDKLRLNASVHTEPLPIPSETVSLALRIMPGVIAQRGGNETGKDTVRAVAIPGLYSLDVSDLKQLIVTGDGGEPENILQVTTGMAVHEKEMARAVGVWQLPEKGPDNVSDGNYAWSDAEEISEAVLKRSKRISLAAVPAEREINETHAFKFAVDPGRYLLVRIAKGLKSAGGYQLGATRDEIIRVKRSAPELSIMSAGSLLSMSGEKKLPIIVRDLPGVQVEIGRLLPAAVAALGHAGAGRNEQAGVLQRHYAGQPLRALREEDSPQTCGRARLITKPSTSMNTCGPTLQTGAECFLSRSGASIPIARRSNLRTMSPIAGVTVMKKAATRAKARATPMSNRTRARRLIPLPCATVAWSSSPISASFPSWLPTGHATSSYSPSPTASRSAACRSKSGRATAPSWSAKPPTQTAESVCPA